MFECPRCSAALRTNAAVCGGCGLELAANADGYLGAAPGPRVQGAPAGPLADGSWVGRPDPSMALLEDESSAARSPIPDRDGSPVHVPAQPEHAPRHDESTLVLTWGEQARPSAARRWRPGRKLLISLGVVTALVIASTVAYNVTASEDTPQAAVQGYFAALERGDAKSALAYTMTNTQVDMQLLNVMALNDPQVRPGGLSVTSVQANPQLSTSAPGGEPTLVAAEFTVAGQKISTTFLLVQRPGSHRDGLFPDWALVDPFAPLAITDQVSGSGYLIDGRAVTSTATDKLVTFPVATTISTPSSPLFDGLRVTAVPQRVDDGTAQIVPGWHGTLTTAVALPARTISPTGQSAVDEQVKRLIDQCAATVQLAPAHCPFSDYVAYTPNTVGWTITQYPQVQIPASANADGTYSFDGSGGQAEARGTYTDYSGTSQTFDDTVPFSIQGTVSIVGSQITVSTSY